MNSRLEEIARRINWYSDSTRLLANTDLFLSQVMARGTADKIVDVQGALLGRRLQIQRPAWTDQKVIAVMVCGVRGWHENHIVLVCVQSTVDDIRELRVRKDCSTLQLKVTEAQDLVLAASVYVGCRPKEPQQKG